MYRVLIIQPQMKRYRVPFFQKLHRALEQDGIELRVAYSAPNAVDRRRNDSADLPPEYGRKVKSLWFGNRFLYQAVWREVVRADLVIVGNENKFLINLILLVFARVNLKTVAFWGIGAEESAIRSSKVSAWVRDRTLNSAHWWFAYTEHSAERLSSLGVTCGITAVQNTVDTSELREALAVVRAERMQLAKSYGLGTGPVGIFCGALIPSKHLPFLLSAAHLIRAKIPDFELLIIGDGPLRSFVEESVQDAPWIHYQGPKFGKEKAAALSVAQVFLLPGNVGLAILDSFVAGLPLVATDVPISGPEVSYLIPGVNGLMTSHDVEAFAAATAELLENRDLLSQLSAGATESGMKYTIEEMAQRFRSGIVSCLKQRNE
jgi:glycosyltransferase involved in cell wall biosynthesis